MYLNNYIE